MTGNKGMNEGLSNFNWKSAVDRMKLPKLKDSPVVSLLSMTTPRLQMEFSGDISEPCITRLSLEILANR